MPHSISSALFQIGGLAPLAKPYIVTAERYILAIESSCDETAVALVSESGKIKAEELSSQISLHNLYGGVVPEVASRAHFEELNALVKRLLATEEKNWFKKNLSAVAATTGPGLIGPLLVGSSYARGLAEGWGLPFIGVHHLRGHLASPLLEKYSQSENSTLKTLALETFPALVLLVSGGHTQILRVDENLNAKKWADTADDAAGECFDKCAKLMGLGYPGGAFIEGIAQKLKTQDEALAKKILTDLPRPRSKEGFSFSGLKTAARQMLEKNPEYKQSPAFCWALQECIADTLALTLKRLLSSQNHGDLKNFIFCGGVSANWRLRESLQAVVFDAGLPILVPPLKYCTDNAAMIGAAAWVQAPEHNLSQVSARRSLEFLS